MARRSLMQSANTARYCKARAVVAGRAASRIQESPRRRGKRAARAAAHACARSGSTRRRGVFPRVAAERRMRSRRRGPGRRAATLPRLAVGGCAAASAVGDARTFASSGVASAYRLRRLPRSKARAARLGDTLRAGRWDCRFGCRVCGVAACVHRRQGRRELSRRGADGGAETTARLNSLRPCSDVRPLAPGALTSIAGVRASSQDFVATSQGLRRVARATPTRRRAAPGNGRDAVRRRPASRGARPGGAYAAKGRRVLSRGSLTGRLIVVARLNALRPCANWRRSRSTPRIQVDLSALRDRRPASRPIPQRRTQ